MGWLWSVGSIKWQVSFAEYRLLYRALLQKRPTILSILLSVATPYLNDTYKCIELTNKKFSKHPATIELTVQKFSRHPATNHCAQAWYPRARSGALQGRNSQKSARQALCMENWECVDFWEFLSWEWRPAWWKFSKVSSKCSMYGQLSSVRTFEKFDHEGGALQSRNSQKLAIQIL